MTSVVEEARSGPWGRLTDHIGLGVVSARFPRFFAESYDEVMRRLVGNLAKLGFWDEDWQVPTKSAITQGRQRLGPEPMKALFERAAVPLDGPGTKGAWLARRRTATPPIGRPIGAGRP